LIRSCFISSFVIWCYSRLLRLKFSLSLNNWEKVEVFSVGDIEGGACSSDDETELDLEEKSTSLSILFFPIFILYVFKINE
jgi:hypothetical protein